jgi:hypothetical protein
MESTNHSDLVKKLKEKPAWAQPKNQGWAGPVSVVPYVLALAAVAHNAQLAYELGLWTVCGFSSSQTTLPAVWCVSAVVLHLLGWLTMRTRLELVPEKPDLEEKPHLKKGEILVVLLKWLKVEATPLHWEARIHLGRETMDPMFLVLASCLYVGTAVQVLYATLNLSSLVYIGVRGRDSCDAAVFG